MSFFASSPRPTEPWFRIGRLEVGTVLMVVLLTAASWLAWAILPSLGATMALTAEVFTGELWRLVTWPWANSLSPLAVINLFFFWYFGTELELEIGRRPMAGLIAGSWAGFTFTALPMMLTFASSTALVGLGVLEMAVFLVWIAQNPHRQFFFGIPAWVIGAILLAIDLLGYVASRLWGGLGAFVLGLVITALLARRAGLLRGYPSPRRSPRPKPAARKTAKPSSSQRVKDQAQLDALLDRINDNGIDSLSPKERRELMKLRDRLRRS